MNAFTTTRRKSMTPHRRAAIFAKEHGICWQCSRRLRPGDDWSVEHVIALQNGGEDTDDNCRVTCAWCKPGKDRADQATAAKGRHRAVRHTVPKEQRKSQRGFKGWRKFDGSIVWAKDKDSER